MISLKHLSGSLAGTVSVGEGGIVRIGRNQDSDVRFDSAQDPAVSNHHAQIVREDGDYYLIDSGSTNGTLVNARRIVKQKLATGDRVCFGPPGGPEAEVEIRPDPAPARTAERVVPTADMTPPAAQSTDQEAAALADALLARGQDPEAAELAKATAEEVARYRARAGGSSSGQTRFIVATAFQQVSELVRERARRHWVKVVFVVAGIGVLVAGGLGVVVYRQHQEIARLLATKQAIDAQITDIYQQMQAEQDPERLAELEQRLGDLTGNAETTLAKLSEANRKKAAEVEAGSDELDREIRRILAQFDASTYAIPPIFRERLQYHIDELRQAGNLQLVYNRKLRYWPAIAPAFDALHLPEEMAYIAWAESAFDPNALSSAGARGMWQMMPTTAQSLGLRVDSVVDERTDVAKQSRAAARHLASLLAEFGEDSFMLAMASYNRGENGVRRVLRQVAREPGGFKKEKRDFWHLYRMKQLPEETREYVPRVLAAAVVCGNPAQYGLQTDGGK